MGPCEFDLPLAPGVALARPPSHRLVRGRGQRHRQCPQRWRVVLWVRGVLSSDQSGPRPEPCRHIVPVHDQGSHHGRLRSRDGSLDRPGRSSPDPPVVGARGGTRLHSAQRDPRVRSVPGNHCAHDRRHAGVRPFDLGGGDPLGSAAAVTGGVSRPPGVYDGRGHHPAAARVRRGDGWMAPDGDGRRSRALGRRGPDVPLPPGRIVGDEPGMDQRDRRRPVDTRHGPVRLRAE